MNPIIFILTVAIQIHLFESLPRPTPREIIFPVKFESNFNSGHPNGLRKPPCGPVLFPDFSCEEGTTCVQVPSEKGIQEDGALHSFYKTTCMVIEPTAATAGVRKVERIDNGWLKLFKPQPLNEYARQAGYTTSTMVPFPGGTSSTPQGPIIDDNKCKNIANCKKYNW